MSFSPSGRIASMDQAAVSGPLREAHARSSEEGRPRIMIFVESVYGFGHFNVVEQIVRALAARTCSVAIASAGLARARGVFEFPGARIMTLPEVQDEESETETKERVDAVFDACREFEPTLVLFEFFPFAMRSRDSDLTAVERYRRSRSIRPKLVCLARDIVFSADPSWTVGRLNRSFDHLLVRGDGVNHRLADCMPEFGAIGIACEYTAMIASSLPPRTAMRDEDRAIVVSAGGGYRPGDDQFIRQVIQACGLSRAGARVPWHVLLSHDCPQSDFEHHVAAARTQGAGIRVRRLVGAAKFRQMLVDCRGAIIRGGYNTSLELAQANVPFLVVPREKLGFNREQSMRAKTLERAGLATCFPEGRLAEADGPLALARALDAAIERRRNGVLPFALDGAERIASRVVQLSGDRFETSSSGGARSLPGGATCEPTGPPRK